MTTDNNASPNNNRIGLWIIGVVAIAACCIGMVIGCSQQTPTKSASSSSNGASSYSSPPYNTDYSPPKYEYGNTDKPPATDNGDVAVRGYYRKDGTYVRPHYRTQQDSSRNNNYSTEGNVNPYTGKPGTRRRR
ncbi:MAG: hypothetical protein WD648_01935 [Planctomycetaceae bacterium]